MSTQAQYLMNSVVSRHGLIIRQILGLCAHVTATDPFAFDNTRTELSKSYSCEVKHLKDCIAHSRRAVLSTQQCHGVICSLADGR